MSDKLMKLIAEAAIKTAKTATNSASFFGFYQPKEPKMENEEIIVLLFD